MGMVPVTRNIYGLLDKNEGTFGTDASPVAATDAFWLMYSGSAPGAPMTEKLGFDGKIGKNYAGLQGLKNAAPSMRSFSLPATIYPRGYGAAYSVTHLPPNGFHAAMLSAGYLATVVTTGGSESVSYAPQGDGTPVSSTLYMNAGRVIATGNYKLYKGLGGLANFKLSTSNAAPPLATFDYVGIYSGNPTEVAYTSPTITDSPTVPNSSALTFSYGGTSLSAVSFDFDSGRDLSTERAPLTAAGAHLGYVPGAWTPILKVQVEEEAISTIDPWALRQAASTGALILGINQATQYNRYKITGAQVQLVNVTPNVKGAMGMWDLEFAFKPSTPTGNDSLAVVFD